MAELDELFPETAPSEILRMAFHGYDEDGGPFNPNKDYFTFNGYGNLVSAWEKDYSDHLDLYVIDELAKHRGDIWAIDEDPDLSDLFDALEDTGDAEDLPVVAIA